MIILLSLFVIVFSLIYFLRFEKIQPDWMVFDITKNLLYYIPVISSLSVLWPVVFRTSRESGYGAGRSGLNFKVTVFLFLVAGGAFVLQEIAVPWMYGSIVYSEMMKSSGIKLKNPVKDATGENFNMAEFGMVNSMKVKNNIAFSTGSSYMYFERMYDGNGAYYVEGLRFIGLTPKKELDFVITADYAKIVSDLIYVVNPLYFDYSHGRNTPAKRTGGIKKIVLAYRPAGIFALSSDSIPETVSLIDVFLYSDFAFNSGINFFRLGNILFNRIAYYIILVLMLILTSTFGSAFKNMRLLRHEYLQTAAFYAASIFLVSVAYDALSEAVNMIYSLLV